MFTRVNWSHVPEPESKFDGQPFENIEITEEEIIKHLKGRKPTKSTGPGGLQRRALKETADMITLPLTDIFLNPYRKAKSQMHGKLQTSQRSIRRVRKQVLEIIV